jgi:hypothetical protein
MRVRIPGAWKRSQVLCYYGSILFARSTRGVLEGGGHLEVMAGLNGQLAYQPSSTIADAMQYAKRLAARSFPFAMADGGRSSASRTTAAATACERRT